MNRLSIKLREVYFPFLIISIATILSYNLFRWIFDIKLGILPLKEDLLNFWIPFAIPWVPILLWLRRRIRILKISRKGGDGNFAYQFAMALAMTVPIIISQNYLQKASYDLIFVNNIQQTKAHEKEKYFKVNTYSLDKGTLLPYVTSRTSGKYNSRLNFHLYISCPFKNAENVWYGITFKKTISNRLNDHEKDVAYKNFIQASERKLKTYSFQNANYFQKLGNSDDRDGFLGAIKTANKGVDEKGQIILVPKMESFVDKHDNSFTWIFASFGIGAFVLLLMTTLPGINKKELNNFKKRKDLKDDDLKEFLEYLNPMGPYKSTSILLLLNIAVFLVMMFSGLNIISPTPQELLEIGGNRRAEVMTGEFSRLLTSTFIHGGLLHLVMNLVGLGLGGMLLDSILGRFQFILSYILCGIVASIASILWYENTVSVGASGAIFGLYGIILAFTIFKIFPRYMRSTTWILLGLYAGGSLLFGFFGGIDNAAHFGGLISGFVIGGILIVTQKEALMQKAK
ncbi:rhomboid family intramembrane serine protease [Zobellia galactanivorans]|uniref:Serine endopeptidase, family S54 n=1 Tax=Zobellia galactanivorans (strain DSM 12802 / CCUG 47099 / CIP 106680 / NCIMB 13871 / Dsij) TaxID=63186 RepID=G0L2E3_ZOBGA|nr:rhomboid family intramembrane serine protease [Zobellia galactanivorans]MBU3026347.1 rhomboid family intramembrane serine protease [Zobellia galactanivorans]CAZ98077.1 Serine endopeptidase, family S54 [Zobellia galactanivorans]